MNLLLFRTQDLEPSGCLTISGERARHIKDVLKLVPGDTLKVGEVFGGIGSAELLEYQGENARLRVHLPLDHVKGKSKESVNRDLVLALPRPQSLKKILQNAATLGVKRIFLISSERGEKNYFLSPVLRDNSLYEHLRLGLEQAGSTDLPCVKIMPGLRPTRRQEFQAWLEETFPKASFKRALADVPRVGQDSKQGRVFLAPVRSCTNSSSPIVFALGPEGGWTDLEARIFCENAFEPFQLSERILRVETAVVATLAQHNLLAFSQQHQSLLTLHLGE